MYMSKGDRAAAMAVVDSGVAKLAFDDNVEAVMQKNPSQADKPIKSKIEQLLKSCKPNDGSIKPLRESSSLIDELTTRPGAPAPDLNKGAVGGHHPPSNWSFAMDGDKDQSGPRN